MPANKEPITPPNPQLIALSGQLLLAVKTEASTDSLESALATINLPALRAGLPDDNARKTFWINTYNAWFQILSVRDRKTRPDIFTKKLITIAETKFSLDDIEHGILRKYRWKYGLGYLPQFFPSKTIKQLCVSTLDYRIHFALNCGAKSCPPIAFYTYELVDRQLEMATVSFLTSETDIDETKREVNVSKILQWFKGDFGGNSGIKRMLSTYFAKDFSAYSIRFKAYDWSGHLKNYARSTPVKAVSGFSTTFSPATNSGKDIPQ